VRTAPVCTILPPAIVTSTGSSWNRSAGKVRGSSPRIARSPSLPTSMLPSVRSWNPVYAALIVWLRSASRRVSRSSAVMDWPLRGGEGLAAQRLARDGRSEIAERIDGIVAGRVRAEAQREPGAPQGPEREARLGCAASQHLDHRISEKEQERRVRDRQDAEAP